MTRAQALMLTLLGTSVFLSGIFLLIIADQSSLPLKNSNVIAGSTTSISDANAEIIEYLIPFHQSVIDQSRLRLAQTKSQDQALFLRKVIDTRVAEISIMKTWYKSWTTQDFALKPEQDANLAKMDVLSDRQFYKDLNSANADGIERISTLQTNANIKTEMNTMSKTIVANLREENTILASWITP